MSRLVEILQGLLQNKQEKFSCRYSAMQGVIGNLPLDADRADAWLLRRASAANPTLLQRIGRCFRGNAEQRERQAVWLLYYGMLFDYDSDRFDLDEDNVNRMLGWSESAFGHTFWEGVHGRWSRGGADR